MRALSFPLKAANIESPGAKTATFSVAFVNPKAGESEVTYVYPAAMVKEDGSLASLAEQDGTLETLQSKFDYARGTGDMTVSGTTATLPASVSLANQLAICALTIKDRKGTDDVSDDVDITGSITSLTVNDGTNAYTISRSAPAPAGPIYVAMNPVSTSLITFDASDGTNTYRKMVQSKTFQQNKIYPVTLSMYKFIDPPTGALPGVFSVGVNKWVYFSKGNLQYQANSTEPPYSPVWRFAEHQYDYLGESAGNTTVEEDRASQTGWIDLFGWGTSGYDHGSVTYQPWSIDPDFAHYYAYGDSNKSLFDSKEGGGMAGQADWGYNAISNGGNAENKWRTLTKDEWKWLLGPWYSNPGTNCRMSSEINMVPDARFVMATIGYVKGLVIFPDYYEGNLPNYTTDVVWFNYINRDDNNYNSYWSFDDWENDFSDNTMQKKGCVFLPVTQRRSLRNVEFEYRDMGYYWSSTSYSDPYGQAYCLRFGPGIEHEEAYNTLSVAEKRRYLGHAVRLVTPAAI